MALVLMQRLLRRDRITGQAARFVVVGLMNTLVDLGALYLLARIPGMPEVAAKAVSYFLGICNSFFWNKYWTFNAAQSARGSREFGMFFLVNLPSYVVNVVVFTLLGLWLESGEWYVRVPKGFAAAVIAIVWNFLGSRYIAFRHSALKRQDEEAIKEERDE